VTRQLAALTQHARAQVREINILLSMRHPHVVDVSEVVTAGRDVYMVMEFVQQDLKCFLERHRAKLKIGEVRGRRG